MGLLEGGPGIPLPLLPRYFFLIIVPNSSMSSIASRTNPLTLEPRLALSDAINSFASLEPFTNRFTPIPVVFPTAFAIWSPAILPAIALKGPPSGAATSAKAAVAAVMPLCIKVEGSVLVKMPHSSWD